MIEVDGILLSFHSYLLSQYENICVSEKKNSFSHCEFSRKWHKQSCLDQLDKRQPPLVFILIVPKFRTQFRPMTPTSQGSTLNWETSANYMECMTSARTLVQLVILIPPFFILFSEYLANWML